MNGQAAPAHTATPDATLTLVAAAALKRFEEAIQSVLDAPLDASRVLEWTTLRAVTAA